MNTVPVLKTHAIGWFIIATISLLTVLTLNVPWFPQYFAYDPDSSWIMVLHESFLSMRQWGQDIIWHYGPLGFLFGKYYHPATYPLLLLVWIFLSLIFFTAAYQVFNRTRANPLLLFIVMIIGSMTNDGFFFALAIMTLVLSFNVYTRIRNLTLYLLVLALAIAALVKISYLVLGLFILVIIELHRMFFRKRFPVIILLYGLFVAGLWALAEQDIMLLPDYLMGALEQARGFSAMATYDRPLAYFAFYTIGIALFFFIVSYVWWKRFRSQSILAMLGLLGIFLMALKVGFIQSNDQHFLEAVAIFMLVALLTKDFFWYALPNKGKTLFFLYTMAAVGAYAFQFVTEEDVQQQKAEEAMDQAIHFAGDPSGVFDFVGSSLSSQQKHYEKAMKTIGKQAPLPKVEGRVDVYNSYQIAAFANGYAKAYAPRPVFQSYHAYTPMFAKMNRDFLKTDKAPEHIFFRNDVMLNRYPTFDDGLSWPELLTYYDIEGIYGDYLHLVRRKAHTDYTMTPIKTEKIHFGEALKVPEIKDGLLWAKIKVTPTREGKIAGWLLKNIPLTLRVENVQEGITTYPRDHRFIPGIASEGFVLSPLIDNTLHYALVAKGEESRLSAVDKVAILPDEETAMLLDVMYEKTIEVEFFHLTFPKQEAPIAHWDRGVEVMAYLSAHPFFAQAAAPEQITDQHVTYRSLGGHHVLRINGSSLLPLLLDNETSVTFNYGLFDPGYDIKRPSEGVVFTIRAGTFDGQEVILWSDSIGKLEQGEQSVHREATIDLSGKNVAVLIFETTPKNAAKSNWSYWSDIGLK